MKKVTIEVNGNLLKNKNTLKFNEPGKQVFIWTFSTKNYVDGVATGILKETLDKLEANGIKDAKVVEVDEAPKAKKEKVAQPKEDNVEEEEEDPEYLFKELNEKCNSCIHDCKQSAKAQIIKCKQFTKVA